MSSNPNDPWVQQDGGLSSERGQQIYGSGQQPATYANADGYGFGAAQPGYGATSEAFGVNPGGYGPTGAQPGYGGYPGNMSGFAQPSAPYGIDPRSGRPYSSRSKVAAGLLQLFVGYVGAGRWYTGHYGIAVAQLLTCGGLGIWALIDAILMLTGSVDDADGYPLRD